MNRFADDRVTRVHAEIAAIDGSAGLEADSLACPGKFAIDFDIEANRPCDAEQGEITGYMGKPRIGLLDARGDEGNSRIVRGIEKRFATQEVVERGRTGIDRIRRDIEGYAARARIVEIERDLALKLGELALGSRPAYRIDEKNYVRMRRIDGPE